ncbi:hypothetical protein E2562_005252 [Oryza meyeriana var. granulata]|uniref:Uncharacterized protein n=1 Tax=Oryza meyeriana var. granulata TaxID=110450 RepID=A0A6G1EEQ6_9ORYZ|nr:hypothetical protein E2562_005252 [Oryza meyeriana var. granulata]
MQRTGTRGGTRLGPSGVRDARASSATQRGDETRDETAPGRVAGTRVLGGGARGESRRMEAARHGSKRARPRTHGSAGRLAGGSDRPLTAERNEARQAPARFSQLRRRQNSDERPRRGCEIDTASLGAAADGFGIAQR